VFLALYWLGMTLARIALASALRRADPIRLLYPCLGIALLGALLVLGTRSLVPAAVGVFLLGVGFAATFPVVLGLVGDRYAHLSGTAFSIVIAIALTGGMLIPYLTGVIGNTHGLRVSFIVVPIALVSLAGLLTVVTSRLVPADS
jgi:fucose permease